MINLDMLSPDETICDCCGSNYLGESPKEMENKWGIAVALGKVGEEFSNQYQTIKHVKTKNGTITISTRNMWTEECSDIQERHGEEDDLW